MKINKNFALRQVAGTWVVMPLAEGNLDFNGMIALNETGSLLWRALEKGCEREDLVNLLTSEFEVTCDEALKDVNEFIDKLASIGCIEVQ